MSSDSNTYRRCLSCDYIFYPLGKDVICWWCVGSGVGRWQSLIGEWHREIFGEYEVLDHIRAIAQKAKEEAQELYDNPDSPEEAADLFIIAFAAADRLGININEEIAKKFAKVKARGKTQLDRDKERGIEQAKERSDVS